MPCPVAIFARFLIPALIAATAFAQNGVITGTVVDARGGEALANVAVQLSADGPRTVSDATGHFRLEGVAAADYVLSVSTVGYHVVKQAFHLGAGESREFEVVLSPDNLGRTDTVDVTSGPFDTAREDSPSSLVLAGNDVRNLASVLADDPLRAVQSLPGVTSNNDFDARFSLRGADYNRVGLYMDDVLLHQPFHMLQGQNVTGSSASFNGDMVEELELHEGAFPARFGNRTAGILDIHTRDGSHTNNSYRFEASASNAGVVAEGPFGKKKRGTWLVGARRSYLQYLIGRIAPNDSSLVFTLEDVQGRFSYDLTPANKVTLYILESYSTLDRTNSSKPLGINSLATGAYHYTFANAGWKFTPSSAFVLGTHAAWMREKYDNFNPTARPLAQGFYGEWVSTTNATWLWNGAGKSNPLDLGFSIRRIRDSGFSAQFQSTSSVRLLDIHDGNAEESEAYIQQSWNAWRGRVHLTAGVHFDHHSFDTLTTAMPAASATLILTPSTRVQLGWGEYAQHQELALLTSPAGGPHLLPLRSNHVIAALEQRINLRTRFRAEFYNRADRDINYRPYYDPRMIGGKVFVPPLMPLWTNSLRGYARGVELFLQRTSANGFTGWVSWGWGRTGMRDGVTGDRFPSEFDERNAISVYVGYRLRPSVNISLHSSYGSGFPIPGYLTLVNGVYFLADSRNQLRIDYYQRTDFRINKSWTRDKWKIALYGEVVNITNRKNYLFDSLNSYNTKTGQTSVTLDSMLPIIPSVGILIER
jgi:hypothetical protein